MGTAPALSVAVLDSAIDALERLLVALDEGRPGARGLAESSLGRLRSAWRENPAAFSPDAIVRLRLLTTRLEGEPCAPTGPSFEDAAATRTGRAPDPADLRRTNLPGAETLPAASEAARPRPRPRRRPRSDLTAAAVLAEIYGYDDFRPGQAEIIEALLAGRDCVGVMPTGAGKSLTYQIPARLLGGTTLVISPLIALMKDQVDALDALGIRATFLNSSLTPEARAARVRAIIAGEVELVYAAPEGLEASAGRVLEQADVRLVAVDEAQCISHWGHDFRPAYRNLENLRERFGEVPILALTATATPRVVDDMITQLGMVRPVRVQRSFFRSNLRIHAYVKGQGLELRRSLLALVRAHAGESGIIYVGSRRAADSTAAWLASKGVRAAAYHAGLAVTERSRVQEAFQRDEIEVVCATIAFGMGIDKPDVRFVLHRDMPRSPEAWYQEIGRAGRDGAPADCVLFYSWSDVVRYERSQSGDAGPDAVAQQARLAREMFRLADRSGCRHRAIVGYLGETIAACGSSCDHCQGSNIIAEASRRPPTPGRSTPTAARTHAAPDPGPAGSPTGDVGELRALLKELRLRIAREAGRPRYRVFHDATLDALIEHRPRTPEALLEVHGIGPKKLAEIGAELLATIRPFA